MFLEVPVWIWDEEEIVGEMLVDINPFHIVSIERYDEDTTHVLMVADVDYYVALNRDAFREQVEDFMKANILSKIYSEYRDKKN